MADGDFGPTGPDPGGYSGAPAPPPRAPMPSGPAGPPGSPQGSAQGGGGAPPPGMDLNSALRQVVSSVGNFYRVKQQQQGGQPPQGQPPQQGGGQMPGPMAAPAGPQTAPGGWRQISGDMSQLNTGDRAPPRGASSADRPGQPLPPSERDAWIKRPKPGYFQGGANTGSMPAPPKWASSAYGNARTTDNAPRYYDSYTGLTTRSAPASDPTSPGYHSPAFYTQDWEGKMYPHGYSDAPPIQTPRGRIPAHIDPRREASEGEPTDDPSSPYYGGARPPNAVVPPADKPIPGVGTPPWTGMPHPGYAGGARQLPGGASAPGGGGDPTQGPRVEYPQPRPGDPNYLAPGYAAPSYSAQSPNAEVSPLAGPKGAQRYYSGTAPQPGTMPWTEKGQGGAGDDYKRAQTNLANERARSLQMKEGAPGGLDHEAPAALHAAHDMKKDAQERLQIDPSDDDARQDLEAANTVLRQQMRNWAQRQQPMEARPKKQPKAPEKGLVGRAEDAIGNWWSGGGQQQQQNGAAPAQSAAGGRAPAQGQSRMSQQDMQTSLDNARAAIKAGWPRDAVIQKLQAAGIDPSGL